jgi:Beta-lactamase enzyme family
MLIRGLAAGAALTAGVMAAGAGIGGGTAAAATTTVARVAAGGLVRAGICTAPPGYQAVAGTLSLGILDALRGRAGDRAVTVTDSQTGVSCAYNEARRFDAASIIKVITLAALLRWHQESGQPLSAWERGEATAMITESDNDAATALWDEAGRSRLQHFLTLAGMSQTQLGPGVLWGLTQVTAHDEMLLLTLLTEANPVLSDSSRSYELGLMAAVIPGQRWGTPAGAPGDVTTQVKNGWLPDGTGWHINSIGAFTGLGGHLAATAVPDYRIAVLTDRDPAEQYGIDTVEAVARVVHRVLNAADAPAGLGTAVSLAPAGAPSQPTALTQLTPPQLSVTPLLTPPTPGPVSPTAGWAVVPTLPVPA